MAAVDDPLVDKEQRCGYCKQKLEKMIEPRLLPCNHANCLLCMNNDYSKIDGFECPQCLVFHPGVELFKLPSPFPKKISSSIRGLDVPAAAYCLECTDKVCDKHVVAHNNFFGDEHQLVTLEEYHKGNYVKKNCYHYPKEGTTEACSDCLRVLCDRCHKSKMTKS